jgi:hypothetical protein
MPKYWLLANRRAGRIAQRLLAKMQQFPFISSELLCFCLYLLKVEEAVENFPTLSGSSPNFPLSNHTTWSQTQTGATVPLNLNRHCVIFQYKNFT